MCKKNISKVRRLFRRGQNGELGMDTCIANLIDDSLGWWYTRIIDEHFFPFEGQIIKSIPLCISP